MRHILAIAAVTGLAIASPASAAIDWSKVDEALGKAGTNPPGDVHKYSLPRSDLQVTVDGVAIKPSLALGGWLAFKPMGEQTMVMGDLVLTEQEINPVLTRLLANGITATAIHNHLLRAQPATFYMHVAGEGDPVKLATGLHDALSASRTPLGSTPAPAAQASVEPTGDGKAAITGDFVLMGKEVNPVVQTLRQNGIEVTALHNHMLDDQPHAYFVHFWANDDAMKLAQGLRAALDKVNVAKS